jgi:hypothetical protein
MMQFEDYVSIHIIRNKLSISHRWGVIKAECKKKSWRIHQWPWTHRWSISQMWWSFPYSSHRSFDLFCMKPKLFGGRMCWPNWTLDFYSENLTLNLYPYLRVSICFGPNKFYWV